MSIMPEVKYHWWPETSPPPSVISIKKSLRDHGMGNVDVKYNNKGNYTFTIGTNQSPNDLIAPLAGFCLRQHDEGI